MDPSLTQRAGTGARSEGTNCEDDYVHGRAEALMAATAVEISNGALILIREQEIMQGDNGIVMRLGKTAGLKLRLLRHLLWLAMARIAG